MRHIFTAIYPFHEINSSRHNNIWLLKSGITMLLYNKDYIEFVTEFPCLLGHPVGKRNDLEIQVTDVQANIFKNILSRSFFYKLFCS